jgi:hypothetical protein
MGAGRPPKAVGFKSQAGCSSTRSAAPISIIHQKRECNPLLGIVSGEQLKTSYSDRRAADAAASGGTMKIEIGLVLAFLALTPVAATSQTQEEQQACMDDAFRVCSQDIPDRDKVAACLARNIDQISPACPP